MKQNGTRKWKQMRKQNRKQQRTHLGTEKRKYVCIQKGVVVFSLLCFHR